MWKCLIFFVCCFLFTNAVNGQNNNLEQLSRLLSGDYSSEAQSKRDSIYAHVVIHIRPIWKERNDGYWFYLEQGEAKAPNKPYRQRVYHLNKDNDNKVFIDFNEIVTPSIYIGGWSNPKLLEGLTVDSIFTRNGCSVKFIKNNANVFIGSTDGSSCVSNNRGANYVTSELTISTNGITTWDRGYTFENKQVWGPKNGGYQFDRLLVK